MTETPIKDLYGNDDVEAMYQQALRVPLKDKIEMAILTIQTYEPMAMKLSDEGYYVCFSGGKDSIVMAKLFEMAGVKYRLHYNNVTIDPPELVQFIKREYPQAQWHSVGTPLPLYMARKSNGPPTRLARWCCEVYKEQGGTGHMKATGVRAAESPRRKGLWKSLNNNNKGGAILCPILYWTKSDIWEFIHQNQMKYCSLYDEGYKRLGCIGCPMGGKNRLKDFERWPKYEALWKRGFQIYWDTWKGVPRRDGGPRWIERMKSVEELWDWWMQTENVNDTDNADCQMFLW
jgi:phosphoadenosine phosphosulfate reductase